MKRDIDSLIEQLQQNDPEVEVEQLRVTHPGADDDGLWFFAQPKCLFEVQVESPLGALPFLIETDEHAERVHVRTVREAIKVIESWLKVTSPKQSTHNC